MRTVYLMRHGEASLDATRDELRPLTGRGRESVGRAATYLSRRLGNTPRVIASPLVRAQETAQLLVEKLAGCPGYTTSREFTPGGSPAVACNMLAGLESDVVVITHQPFVGRFISFLTGEDIFVDTANLVAIRLEEFGQEMGEIVWVYCE